MASQFDRSDWGIIFYGSTAGTLPTYTDIRGQEQTAVQLVNGTKVYMDADIASAYFHVGSAGRFTLTVEVNVSDEATIDAGLEGHNVLDPLEAFAELVTYRNNDQQTKSVHTFDVSGQYILQTANLGAIAEAAIAATYAVGGGESFAEIIVSLRVEP